MHPTPGFGTGTRPHAYFKSSKRRKQGQQEDIFIPLLTLLFVCLPLFEVFLGPFTHIVNQPWQTSSHGMLTSRNLPLICKFCHQRFSLKKKNLKSFLIKCLRFSGTTSPSSRHNYDSPDSHQSALHHGSLWWRQSTATCAIYRRPAFLVVIIVVVVVVVVVVVASRLWPRAAIYETLVMSVDLLNWLKWFGFSVSAPAKCQPSH